MSTETQSNAEASRAAQGHHGTPRRDEGAGREDRDANRLRLLVCPHSRQRGDRRGAGRRQRGECRPWLRDDRPDHPRPDDFPCGFGRPRRATGTRGGRYALRLVPGQQSARARERGPDHERVRRPLCEDGGRRVHHRECEADFVRRHSGDGAPRAHAAVDLQVWHVCRPCHLRRRGRPTRPRCATAAGCRLLRHRPRENSGAVGRARRQTTRHSR